MRRAWIVGALALAAASLQAPASHALGCGVGAGYDLFRTDAAGTYYNPIADALNDALDVPIGNIGFKGIPLGHYTFTGVGDRPTATTDTIVQRLATVPFPGGTVPIELVSLQLQADTIAGIAIDAPVYVTLQSARGTGLLDGPPGARSLGAMNVQIDPNTCSGGTIQASFTVNFDVRVLGLDGPIVLSRSLSLTTTATWGNRPPTQEIENCHPHTIRTGVHCTLGPPTLIDKVNVNVDGGDFYLGGNIGTP